ncbi:MAG: serine/threonine protein kinase, partial [Actinomycetes bacterium]|nr:serine/threonine protein kinase [Actinomycetes bacterium]MDX5379899.1 serine/threonine protein kinase [Actinomycetes bacterium]MDX5398386.1 serine/threonine protein kinase [Actinomycetes bacterium]MDX5449608.1 serine/threonine protein kinase [Actinomycetes bacterium]
MQEIGGYRVVRRIGSGGMGTVYEALDAEDRAVALKLLHPQISHDPSARARLAREVDLLHRVRGKGVARVLDAEVEDDEAFVVTELIDGPTLEEDVAAHGPFAPDELRALAHGLADALHAIHRVGVVHRDLKPGNVMLSRTGPVIIDFGIAQVADDVRLTQTGMVAGTPGYLDPQVVDGAAPSPVCDWWAWSAVVVFAATGRRPFGTGPSAAVIKRMSLGQVDLEGVDPLVATALWAALQPDPASRLDPHSVLAVLDGRWDRQDLDEALASLRLRSPGTERTAVVPTAPAVMPATPQPTLTLPTTQPTLVASSSPRVDPGRQVPQPVPVQPAPASVAPVG